nr:hypothetical protein [Tanacetum cinerariifolium]
MDAPPSLNHVFNFSKNEFEEDPQEEPKEEFKEDPEEDPEEDTEEELEVEAEDDVSPPATPSCMNKIGRDLGDEKQFSNLVENRMTKLEDKDQEKAEKMEKMKKRLGTLKTNYALIAEAIEEYEKTRANPGNASGSGSTNTSRSVNGKGCTHKTFMNGKPHPFNRTEEALEARDAARNLKPLVEGGGEQEDKNGDDHEGGNGRVNGNGGNENRRPLNFNGTEGVVGLIRWFEKMETVFHISNYPQKYQVKYGTCTLLNSALTWWNSHKRAIGIKVTYAMTWMDFMKLMTEVYYLRNEIQKIMVPNEEDKVERFITSLPDNIQGNVIDVEPTRIQDAICIANNLMNQKLKGYARTDALSKKERLKPRRVRAMSMTIQSGLKAKILEAQGEASKDLKAPAEWLRGLETDFERRDDDGIYFFDRI